MPDAEGVGSSVIHGVSKVGHDAVHAVAEKVKEVPEAPWWLADIRHFLWDCLVFFASNMFDISKELITPETIVQAIGTCCAFLAMVISLTHICRHWYYNKTKLRKSTVRLLFVIPLFALDAWGCLMLEASLWQFSMVFTCAREVYEAVALVSFMELVLTCLGGTDNLVQMLEKGKEEEHLTKGYPQTGDEVMIRAGGLHFGKIGTVRKRCDSERPYLVTIKGEQDDPDHDIWFFLADVISPPADQDSRLRCLSGSSEESTPVIVDHIWPLCWVLAGYEQGPEFVSSMLLGIFQFVYVCLAYTVITVFVWVLAVNAWAPWWLVKVLEAVPNLVKAISCAWALNCMVLFANEIKEKVPPCGLILKFFAIKGVVFFTFWQAIAICFCEKTGKLQYLETFAKEKAEDNGLGSPVWSQQAVKSGINDFLLCIEVLGFALLHLFAYPPRAKDELPAEFHPNIEMESDSTPIENALNAVNLFNLRNFGGEMARLAQKIDTKKRSRRRDRGESTGSGIGGMNRTAWGVTKVMGRLLRTPSTHEVAPSSAKTTTSQTRLLSDAG